MLWPLASTLNQCVSEQKQRSGRLRGQAVDTQVSLTFGQDAAWVIRRARARTRLFVNYDLRTRVHRNIMLQTTQIQLITLANTNHPHDGTLYVMGKTETQHWACFVPNDPSNITLIWRSPRVLFLVVIYVAWIFMVSYIVCQ